MGLFDQILNAVNDPNLQANAGQLANIFNSVQQVQNNQGTDNSTMQSALSGVGSLVRSSLQQKRAEGGNQLVESIINQFAGTSPNPSAVNALFGSQWESVADVVSQRTGIDRNTILQMLPMLVPLVLNFLQAGNNTQNPQGENPVVNNFLDADGDGDVDIADAMQMAGRYFTQ
ncbi:DUF937 domain-containing protein [Aerosakkonemataceae cyanobacterium BLCC-F154]|uniref:DUF937 domain-containing protein n=1 Tax=Floridaenema fluviatile BLCC-F154 TaxID=3153640 RepID=A0ABV4Y4E0_9CYAN